MEKKRESAIDWEKPEDVCEFLETFNAYYSDYTAIHEGEYCDICFATAKTLFYLTAGLSSLSKKPDESWGKELSREEIVKHLREKVVIFGELNTGSGGHSWVMLPYKNVVIIVQSLGGLYASFFTVWDPVRLKLELEGLERGDTENLFYFVDRRAKEFKITYRVAKRKDLKIDILPKRDLKWLKKERDEYLNERRDEKGNLKHKVPDNYLLTRSPDAIEAMKAMENPIDLQKRINRCSKGMKGITSS